MEIRIKDLKYTMGEKNDQFANFLQAQNQSWQLSADNYHGLDLVEEREFLIDGCQIKVQFNPERMRSSAAKVDSNSIAARKCFLCNENRPEEQKSIDLGNGFLLLVNPFPIFIRHFTIPSKEHTPQLLIRNLRPMFEIARQMEGYTLFYNGPECGASAPDHLHFQAGENGFMPAESEFEVMKQIPETMLFRSDNLRIWAFDRYLRKMISFETSNLEQGVMAIENLCTRFSEIQTEKVEPMMNLLCYFRNGKWVIHLFPRRLHRPWQFFEEGDRRLLISPASVDFGGVFITPRREDFDKIKASDIEDIFCQVSLGDGEFLKLKMSITNYKLQITNYKLNSGTMKQPKLKIGILVEREINFCLMDEFLLNTNGLKYSGYQSIRLEGSIIFLNGLPISGKELLFVPLDEKICSFELSDVTIGVQFHWERKENQFFKGALQFQVEAKKLVAINILSLEDYLISVISSEMSATSSMELLKAHAITSRSWLIAQVVKGKELRQSRKEYQTIYKTDTEYIRWYDREDHTLFDVCADDHCQRYQGITRQTSTLVEKAVNETSGQILMFNDQVCDARFSKSCGGVTETFEKVWEPVVHPYLQKVMDCENVNSITSVDLTKEADAEKWIRTSPDAFCNTTDYKVLSQVLNDYDQETVDFYRWKVTYSQEEISVLIAAKTGIDFGTILNLVPIERGFSGRIVKMEILGAKKRLIVGKELEIRKILSVSHLYSSAFVVDRYEFTGEIPGKFILTGAGWGHGVGLCQIGAAMMGEKGYSHEEILMHYFVGAELKKAY